MPRTLVFGDEWEGLMDRRNVLSLSAPIMFSQSRND
jgi:hypothetical protein